MIDPKIMREHVKRHKKTIITSHNCGHVIYWTVSAVAAPSLLYGCLAGTLAVLTIGLAILEE